jgi:dihydroneopterin aldolase
VSRRIFLRDFRLKVSIGIHDFEKEGPQTVVVNLDLCLAQPGVIEARVSTEKPDVYGDCRVGYEAVRRK